MFNQGQIDISSPSGKLHSRYKETENVWLIGGDKVGTQFRKHIGVGALKSNGKIKYQKQSFTKGGSDVNVP